MPSLATLSTAWSRRWRADADRDRNRRAAAQCLFPPAIRARRVVRKCARIGGAQGDAICAAAHMQLDWNAAACSVLFDTV